ATALDRRFATTPLATTAFHHQTSLQVSLSSYNTSNYLRLGLLKFFTDPHPNRTGWRMTK
ncbi:hypothetical protein, partial [Candidatus Competibacter denitrificans]|uniref:hypothetical protein n=1 Tax=Candidatus Competibacter denitrificans TaxID=1400862 RepID=UPI001A7E820D